MLAAQKLQLAEVPVDVADNLTPAQAKSYRLMDNRSHEEAEWDKELLIPEIAELQAMSVDMLLTGFDVSELDAFAVKAEAIVDGETDEDAAPPPPDNPVSVAGDVWRLGRHRLLCGDATSIDALDRLMDGKRQTSSSPHLPTHRSASTMAPAVFSRFLRTSTWHGSAGWLPICGRSWRATAHTS